MTMYNSNRLFDDVQFFTFCFPKKKFIPVVAIEMAEVLYSFKQNECILNHYQAHSS